MKKAIFLCNFEYFGIETLKYLIDFGIEAQLVSYRNKSFKGSIHNLAPNAFLLSYEDIIRAKFPRDFLLGGFAGIPVDPKIIESLAFYERIFLPMMHRLNYSNLSVLKLAEYYYKYLTFWNGVFSFLKPEIIFFHNTPHEGSNFVAYALAKYYGIQTLMPEKVLFRNKYFIINDMFNFPKFDKKLFLKNIKKDKVSIGIDLELVKSIQLNYLKAFDKKEKPFLHKRVTKLLGRYFSSNNLDLDPIFSLQSRYPNHLISFFLNYRAKLKVSALRQHCKRISSIPNLNCKFIYFPLHLQPERTTLPMGKIFYSHQVVLDYILSAAPKDWKVYIKEHPRQFTRQEIYAPLVRDKMFYRDLLADSRVSLISETFDSQELIKSAICVATINGTSGWEAIVQGKPVCLFGNPWYVECPEIFRVSKHSIYDLKKYLNAIDIGKIKIDLDEVSYYATWVKKYLCTDGALKISNLTSEEALSNSKVLAEAFFDSISDT